MADDEWLATMAQYAHGWESEPNDLGEGGAIELSRGLRTEVRRDPERFTRLTDRMDASLHPAYFEAILQGLARTEDGGRGPGTLSQVCTVLRRITSTGADIRRAEIASVIGALADEPIPDDILTLLREIARHDADPQSDDWQDRSPAYGPMNQAINSARGAAAYAMSRLLLSDPDQWPAFRPIIKELARDPVLAVRTATVRCLLAVLDTNRRDALASFRRLVDGADEILAEPFLVRFIHFAIFRDYAEISPVLQKMLQSPRSEVAVAGATQLAVAALSIDEASDDLDQLANLGEEARIGVTRICAANLANPALAEECELRLAAFFADESLAVRNAAGDCWINLEPDQIAGRGHLIRAFAQAMRSDDDASILVHKLREAQRSLPTELCDFTERWIETSGSRAGTWQFQEGGRRTQSVAPYGSPVRRD